jgi:hypothetical protein
MKAWGLQLMIASGAQLHKGNDSRSDLELTSKCIILWLAEKNHEPY